MFWYWYSYLRISGKYIYFLAKTNIFLYLALSDCFCFFNQNYLIMPHQSAVFLNLLDVYVTRDLQKSERKEFFDTIRSGQCDAILSDSIDKSFNSENIMDGPSLSKGQKAIILTNIFADAALKPPARRSKISRRNSKKLDKSF